MFDFSLKLSVKYTSVILFFFMGLCSANILAASKYEARLQRYVDLEAKVSQGNVAAMTDLALGLYYNEFPNSGSISRVLWLLEQAAEQDEVQAIMFLEDVYRKGNRFDKDKLRAQELREKLSTLDLSGKERFKWLVLGCSQIEKESVRIGTNELISSASSESQLKIAHCWLNFKVRDQKLFDALLPSLTSSAEKGHWLASYVIAKAHDDKLLNSPDVNKAILHYKNAYERTKDIDIGYRYIYLLRSQRSNKKRFDSVFSVAKQLAEKGHIKSMLIATQLALSGIKYHLPVDKLKTWLDVGIEKGFGNAILYKAIAIELGRLGEPSLEKALPYYEKAAKRGLRNASAYLGYIYESGKLGSVNITKAISYYKMAAKKSHKKAKQRLEVLM
ncbi:SEL1-like repeat protein [Pseudoalteromonas sp. C2R02]|uniref:tetratricopeptide repeat protein n=1 Tax=Pseudoalteromonas sp. C2R02 TaxID=2841565 RepID=UPI001C0988EF|nr:SEL1-like repeat protein [Pseudoalteromonas sp. C2R02]MBU2971747.1 SEL1-like repeat protein [Pseudoalteromonas sp. C2R02]